MYQCFEAQITTILTFSIVSSGKITFVYHFYIFFILQKTDETNIYYKHIIFALQKFIFYVF